MGWTSNRTWIIVAVSLACLACADPQQAVSLDGGTTGSADDAATQGNTATSVTGASLDSTAATDSASGGMMTSDPTADGTTASADDPTAASDPDAGTTEPGMSETSTGEPVDPTDPSTTTGDDFDPFACLGFGSMGTCNNADGCEWVDSACLPQGASEYCDSLNMMQCLQIPFCEWDAKDNECSLAD